jgi:hypothetical protein
MDLSKQLQQLILDNPKDLYKYLLTDTPKDVTTGWGMLLGLLGITPEAYTQGLADPTSSRRKLIESGEVYADPRELDRLQGEENILGTLGSLIGSVAPYSTSLEEMSKMMGFQFQPPQSINWLRPSELGNRWTGKYYKSRADEIESYGKRLDEMYPRMAAATEPTSVNLLGPGSSSGTYTSGPEGIIDLFYDTRTVDMPWMRQVLGHESVHRLQDVDPAADALSKILWETATPLEKTFIRDRWKGYLGKIEKHEGDFLSKSGKRSNFSPEQHKAIVKEAVETAAAHEYAAEILGNHGLGHTNRNILQDFLMDLSGVTKGEEAFAKATPNLSSLLDAWEVPKTNKVLQILEDWTSYKSFQPSKSSSKMPPAPSPYSSDEIRKVMKDELSKVISTSSKGVVKPRSVAVRGLIEEKELKEPVKGVGRGKGVKEYIPTEASKTQSSKPLYSSPVVDENKAFADSVVKGLNPRIRDKVWKLVMESLQEGKP